MRVHAEPDPKYYAFSNCIRIHRITGKSYLRQIRNGSQKEKNNKDFWAKNKFTVDLGKRPLVQNQHHFKDVYNIRNKKISKLW